MKKRKETERDINDLNFNGSRQEHYWHCHYLKYWYTRAGFIKTDKLSMTSLQ